MEIIRIPEPSEMKPENTQKIMEQLDYVLQFEISRLSHEYNRMSREQAIEACKYLTALNAHNRQVCQQMIAKEWGLTQDD